MLVLNLIVETGSQSWQWLSHVHDMIKPVRNRMFSGENSLGQSRHQKV